MPTKSELYDRIEQLEKEQRGTAKALKNIEDIQAGIGVSAIYFQRIKTYIFAVILGAFGLGYIIYAYTNEKNAHIKETDYVIGAVCLSLAFLIIFIFNYYAKAVQKNKKLQVFNAFMIESQMLAGRR